MTVPMLTVGCGGARRTFPPDRDVIVGRDVRADFRVPDPIVSRAHVILRPESGGWIALDNKSLNGMFVGGQQVQSTPVRDGGVVNIGNPDGPPLVFSLAAPPDDRPTRVMGVPVRRPEPGTAVIALRNRWRGQEPTGARPITIGRALDNDIVLPDVLASRHHARLVPTPSGVRLQQARGGAGTFVNGARVRDAPLREHDLVTIGNVDLVFTDGQLVPRSAPAAASGGLEVRGVGLTVERGTLSLLDRVSLTARPGTLTGVIGPSGSGKSTLLRVLVGASEPSTGTVTFDGRNLHAEYAALSTRIGMVPQDDVVHRGLTVTQALDVGARLRMPPGTTKADRRQVISRVLAELGMTAHADTRVDRLSGGQRKRVSVAMELLTEPSLLVLDEPTTGLDPALDRQVMTMLRQLADAGRVIIVVTHSLAFLDNCDQVLLLAPGGKAAYCGPPDQLGAALGSTDWADVFTGISADPEGAQRRYFAGRPPEPVAQQLPHAAPAPGKPLRASVWRQFTAISLRQLHLLVSSRRYLLFLIALPLIVGLLPLAVGGDAGFTKPPPGAVAPFEPRQIISLLNFAAILMGTTLAVRDLIAERPIYRHEKAAGLSGTAYLLAKIVVFGAVAVVQSAVLVLVVTAPVIGKRPPETAVVLGIPMLELFADVAATAVVAVLLGLAISSVSRSSDQYIPLMAVACTAQLVFAGSFIPITGRPALEALAALAPSRWGFAATAATVDLTNLVPVTKDSHWLHTPGAWWFDIGMLVVLGAGLAGFVRWRLR